MRYSSVLTINASDSIGGAGIQADIKTISSLGCYACSIISSLVIQNTTDFYSICPIESDEIENQIKMLEKDIKVGVIKSGVLPTVSSVMAVSKAISILKPCFYVLDLSMFSENGQLMISEEVVKSIQTCLFPLSTVVIVDAKEYAFFSGKFSSDDYDSVAEKMFKFGCNSVIVRGTQVDEKESVDAFFEQHQNGTGIKMPFVETCNTYGSKTTFSSAMASYLAMGEDLKDAFFSAEDYLIHALYGGKDVSFERSCGPLNQLWGPKSLLLKD